MDNATGSRRGERATGTPNTIYDLSSVLFHALEGEASYDTYSKDAEREGHQELAAFFHRVRDEDSARADEAQVLLAERTPTTERTGGTTTGAMAGTEPSDIPPMSEEGPLRRAKRDSLGRELTTTRSESLVRQERLTAKRRESRTRQGRSAAKRRGLQGNRERRR